MDSVGDIPASRDRFPDSEICGSKSARLSPQLIAACYVLHRLCAPRHPPDALALTLDRSAFVPCPERRPALRGALARAPQDDAQTRNGHLRSVLSVVLEISRLCIRQIPPFTISENRIRNTGIGTIQVFSAFQSVCFRRSRISVLIPVFCLPRSDWWSRSGSNRRPQACKARALPTELRPLQKPEHGVQGSDSVRSDTCIPPRASRAAGGPGTS